MAKFTAYVAKLNDAEYRNFVEERLDILSHVVEKLARTLESEMAALPDPTLTEAFMARRSRIAALQDVQGLMQTRFTGD